MQWYGCRDCNISCQVIISNLEIWTTTLKVLATFPCGLEDHSGRIWHELMDVWVITGYGETGQAGHAPSLSALSWNQRWIIMLKMCVHKRTRAENNPTNHYQKQILITCNDHPNFWMQFQCVMFNNKTLIHLNYQWQHSLHVSCDPIPITKTYKKWDMTLSSWMAMNSVMRDIHDARMVPMEKGWVALYYMQYANIQIIDFRTTWTMDLWIWITPFLRTVLYRHAISNIG